MAFITPQGILGLPWIVYLPVCLIISTIYYFVWPDQVIYNQVHFIILRYGHSLVWILLGLATLFAHTGKLGGLSTAEILAKASLFVYAVFMIAFIITKF